MKLRVRLALMMTIGFIVAGSVLLLVNAFTFEYATYRSPAALTDVFLKKLGVPREVALQYVRAHPESVLQNAKDDPPGGAPVIAAYRDAQREIQHQAVDRSRTWTAIAIGV